MEPEQPVIKHISEWAEEFERNRQALNAVLTNGGTLEGWEGWVYDPSGGGYLTDPDDTYDLPVSQCRTAGGVVRWLTHMSEKSLWVTNALLGGLVRALDDVVVFHDLADRAREEG